MTLVSLLFELTNRNRVGSLDVGTVSSFAGDLGVGGIVVALAI